MFWQMLKTSSRHPFNSALLSNYGVMWVILSKHAHSCCLLIHSKQTQLGVGRRCTASWGRRSGTFNSVSSHVGFLKGNSWPHPGKSNNASFVTHLQWCSRKINCFFPTFVSKSSSGMGFKLAPLVPIPRFVTQSQALPFQHMCRLNLNELPLKYKLVIFWELVSQFSEKGLFKCPF